MRNDADWSKRQTTWPPSFRRLPPWQHNRPGGKMQTSNAENASNDAIMHFWTADTLYTHSTPNNQPSCNHVCFFSTFCVFYVCWWSLTILVTLHCVKRRKLTDRELHFFILLDISVLSCIAYLRFFVCHVHTLIHLFTLIWQTYYKFNNDEKDIITTNTYSYCVTAAPHSSHSLFDEIVGYVTLSAFRILPTIPHSFPHYSIPHFTFRIPHSTIPHFTNNLSGLHLRHFFAPDVADSQRRWSVMMIDHHWIHWIR